MENWDLPTSWTWTTLEEISKINMGQSPPSNTYNGEKRGLPFYQGKSDFGDFFPTPKTWCSKPQKIANENDILITVRAPVGPTNLANEKCCIGRGLAAIFPLDKIPPRLVLYYLRFVEKEIASMGSGSTFTSVNRSDLESIPFPLPPPSEQKLIVQKIEDLFKESKTARETLDKIPEMMKKFRQSILAKAFRGELIPQDSNNEPAEKLLEKIKQERRKKREEKLKERGNDSKKFKFEDTHFVDADNLPKLPKNMIWANIGNVETFVGSGITPLGGRSVYVKEGIPFIRSQNVYPDGLRLDDVAYVTKKLHEEMSRTHMQSGDVLLNITGASIGRSTFVPEGFGPGNVNQHVCIIRTGGLIHPKYLSYWLNSPLAQDHIFSTEAGVTREGLNYVQIRSLPLPYTSPENQLKIINKIDELFSFAGQIEKSVGEAKKRADRIDQAILAKAFRGELVPQDPNDEPASSLLEKIRKEKALELKQVGKIKYEK